MSKDGGRKLLIPMITVTIGALALSGIFPFSGFFSKEAVLGQLWSLDNKLWVGLGLFGAFLTAYYTFRVIFVMLYPGLMTIPPGRSITRRRRAATATAPTIWWRMWRRRR